MSPVWVGVVFAASLAGSEQTAAARAAEAMKVGQLEQASELYREALTHWRGAEGNLGPRVAAIECNLAEVSRKLGKIKDAESLFDSCIPKFEKLNQEAQLASSLTNLGILRQEQGNLADAEIAHRRALEIKSRLLVEGDCGQQVVLNNLGFVLLARGKAQEAEEILRRGLSASCGRATMQAGMRAGLSSALIDLRRFDEAEQMLRAGLEQLEAAEPSIQADMLNNLGRLYLLTGRRELAEPALRRSMELTESLPPKHASLRAAALRGMGELYLLQQKLNGAEKLFRQSLDQLRSAGMERDASALLAQIRLATTLALANRYTEAGNVATEAEEHARELWGDDTQQYGHALLVLAVVQWRAESSPKTVASLNRAIELISRFERNECLMSVALMTKSEQLLLDKAPAEVQPALAKAREARSRCGGA